MFTFKRKNNYPEYVLEEANCLLEKDLLVVPNKDCFKAYYKGLVIIEKLKEDKFSIIGTDSIKSYQKNRTQEGDGLYELLDEINKQETREECKILFFNNVEQFKEIIKRGMPADKERVTSQMIAMNNMSFEDDKYSVCGWETTLGKGDILIHKADNEEKFKTPEIDLVMVNPSKREMILVEYKCKGDSMTGAKQNIAQHGIDYMQVLYSNHMSEIRDELLNAYNVCRKMKGMYELPRDIYNEYKVKIGFLFVDKIIEEGKVVSEITEKDYETGMKLINNNCQYLGDNLVYIRAKTIDEVKFDEWKIVRDSGLKVTIQ